MYRILFICTGNACRSATAEFVLKKMLKGKGIRDVEVYSAGTLDWGKHPRDPVMARIAGEYGYTLTGETTCMTSEILEEMDLILVMTSGHQEEVKRLLRQDHWDRIHLFMEYCFGEDVPLQDPHYQSEHVYRETFSRIERGCGVIVGKIENGEISIRQELHQRF